MPRFAPHPEKRPSIVTGASSGIGAATAFALAEAGQPVALGARRMAKSEEVTLVKVEPEAPLRQDPREE